MIVKALPPPEFSADEQTQIVTDLLALKKTQIGEFLARVEIPRSGTKEAIRGRIESALETGAISLAQVVLFLDEVIPWGKQHVILYKGPQSSIANWKKADWVSQVLRDHRLAKYLNAALPLALPDKMKVSSVLHDGRRLRVTAIKKREWWERNPEYDEASATREGDAIELRAFVHRVTRSLVAFEWDLNANTGFLQISQLPTGFRYDTVAQEFFDLVSAWLDINTFSIVDLRPAINKLQELEGTKTPEARSHDTKYRSLEGRVFGVRSPSPADSVLGEAPLDAALAVARKDGVGHLGNFYWLPTHATNPVVNPLEDEVHVIVVGASNRINFPTPNVEQDVRYVLSRMRSHSE